MRIGDQILFSRQGKKDRQTKKRGSHVDAPRRVEESGTSQSEKEQAVSLCRNCPVIVHQLGDG